MAAAACWCHVMFYNKDILAEAGVSSDDINTWHDFVEAGKS